MQEETHTTSEKTILYEDPLVYTIDNFISDEECEHMKMLARPNLQQSVVSTDKGGVLSSGRSSKTAWIDHKLDDITTVISNRCSTLVDIPIENAEKFQVVYYGTTNEYRAHYDSWDHNGSEKTLRCIKFGGPRLLTALVYLNDVEKGGGTKFTKLDIEVKPKKGRLLVFQNTLKDSIDKHILSEHAGMPVIEGEKYIFNLWFRQCNRQYLYSHFHPEYYTIKDNTSEVESIENALETKENVLTVMNSDKNIHTYDQFLSSEECNLMINSCHFSDSKYPQCWLKNTGHVLLINKISELLKIDSSFFENMNVIKYKGGSCHGPFYDAYDINSERGKQYTSKLGQRLKTVVISLTGDLIYNFDTLKHTVHLEQGKMIMYDNVCSSRQRDSEMNHTITNNSGKDAVIVNIYIRELNHNKELNTVFSFLDCPSANVEENIKLEVNPLQRLTNGKATNIEDYMQTYENVLDMFQKQEVTRSWNSYKSFSYNYKAISFDEFKESVLAFKQLRDEGKGLNKSLLEETYEFDEFHPINLKHILNDEMAEMVKSYYDKTIKADVFALGDRQSKRYRANNEPFSRLLHYEILPLIEHITKQKLRPTYTYLSCYVKGSDLPAHTDREDCQYTVSFLVNKDKDWAVYCDPEKQPVKGRGRYPEFKQNENHIGMIGEPNGLIMFNGEDHIHWRNEYMGERYDVLLLHYRHYHE